jgi:lipoprotein-anchoring transpeptidase ErfK/SrfK
MAKLLHFSAVAAIGLVTACAGSSGGISSGPRSTVHESGPSGGVLAPSSVLVADADGAYAYGLSAHSTALSTFDGSDAEIGVHGNNDPSVLGQSVTQGCVRMDNTEISRLASVLPLGTPVMISA